MTTLASLIRIRGRYHRSVNIGADWADNRALSEYIPTPTIIDLAAQIAAHALRPDGSRAWSLTGPYGAGKSAFALFLADVLSSARPRHVASKRLRGSLNAGLKVFHPILLTADRSSLETGLRSALSLARRELRNTPRGRPPTDVASILSRLRTRQRNAARQASCWLLTSSGSLSSTRPSAVAIRMSSFFSSWLRLWPAARSQSCL